MFYPLRGNALLPNGDIGNFFSGNESPEKRSLRAHAEKRNKGNGGLPDSAKTGTLSNKAPAIASRFFKRTILRSREKVR